MDQKGHLERGQAKDEVLDRGAILARTYKGLSYAIVRQSIVFYLANVYRGQISPE